MRLTRGLLCVFVGLGIALFLPGAAPSAPDHGSATAGCCVGVTGNVNMTGIVDLSDLSNLISYLVSVGIVLPCPAEADLNNSGFIDLTDLSTLISYLVSVGVVLPPCPDTGISFADRQAAFDAIDSVEAALFGVSPDSLARALVAFLDTRPEFEEAGIIDTPTVWARFTDGRLLIMPNNRFPDANLIPPVDLQRHQQSKRTFSQPKRRFASWQDIERTVAIQRAPSAVTYEMPHSVTAFLGNTLSPWCFKYSLDHVAAMLQGGGYIVDSGGTVEDLLSLTNCGLFYIDAHGSGRALTRDQRRIMAVWTSTEVTDDNDNLYDDLLNWTELAYMKAKDLDFATCESVERYAFTADFVAQYMSFTPQSFVYISACNSDNTDLKTAFKAAGASVYAGWSHPVTDMASNRAGLYMIERMLGTSRTGLPSYAVPEEYPKQRPFGITTLYPDMVTRKFDRENYQNDPARLKISYLQGGFELLAPSIRSLQVIPRTDTVEMTGYFGSDPGNKGHVFVNGVERPVLSWEPWLIRFDLPPDGPGSAGPVTVELDPLSGPSAPKRRISNPVNLTQWNGTFTYSEEDAGSLKKQMSMTVKIRADVHSFREFPHDTIPEMNPFIVIGRVEGDTGRVSASGEWLYHAYDDPYEDWLYEWSGSTPIGLLNEPDPSQGFAYQGFIKHSGSNKWMELNLFGSAYYGTTQTVTSTLTGLLSTEDLSISPVMEVYDDILTYGPYTLFIPLYPDWTTFGGTNDTTMCCSLDPDNPDITAKMTWNNIVPTFPPDSTAPR